jgi:hypothetical protein
MPRKGRPASFWFPFSACLRYRPAQSHCVHSTERPKKETKMPRKGSFNIPYDKTVPTSGARRAYRIAFSTEWDCDDDYLYELAKEFRAYHHPFDRDCAEFIQWMRENDDTPDLGTFGRGEQLA